MTCEMNNNELRSMLFGTFGDDPVKLGERLNACLRGVLNFLLREMGSGEALRQTVAEWSRIIDLAPNFEGIAAKRGAFLFACHREKSILAFFSKTDAALVYDLRTRVLPIVIPSFVANMAQTPDLLVLMTLLLVEAFPEPDFGKDRIPWHERTVPGHPGLCKGPKV